MTRPLQLSRVKGTPASEMAQWFRNALTEYSPLPSTEQTNALAHRFKIIVNQADNGEKMRLGRGDLKDVIGAVGRHIE